MKLNRKKNKKQSPKFVSIKQRKYNSAPRMEDFNSLMKKFNQGRFKEVEREALLLSNQYPMYFFPWKMLGAALVEQERNQEALKILKRALKLNPDDFEIYNTMSSALRRLNKMEEALAGYDMALAIKPDYAEAHNNKGLVFHQLGKIKEAAKCYARALEIKPDYPVAHNNLGNALIYLGDLGKAQNSFKRALSLKPDYASAYESLIELYEKTNQMEPLRQTLLNIKTTIPHHYCISYGEALLLRNNNEYEKAIERIQTINAEAMTMTKQINYYFFVAELHDRTTQYDKAFEYFSKANKLTAQMPMAQTVSKARYVNFVDSLLHNFTENLVSGWNYSEVSSDCKAPVFILGFPRSGTTLLDTILRSHPGVEVVEEKPAVDKILHLLSQYPGDFLRVLSSVDEKARFDLAHAYFEELHKYVRDPNSLIIDKFPLNIVKAGIIKRIFPDARFIFAQRHPCDCVLSCFMQNFNLNDAMANFFEIESAAILYGKVMTLWTQYCELLNLNVHNFVYEDLLTDFDGTIGSLLSFLNLNWDPALLNYRMTALKRGKINTPSYNQVTQPLYNHAKGRWEHYKEHMVSALPTLLPWAKKFGYKTE